MEIILNCIGIFLFWSAAVLHAQNPTVDTIQFSGPSSNRVDIVFLGDGWLASEATAMKTTIQNHINAFFKVPEYSRYRKFFNIYRVNNYRPLPSGNLQNRTNYEYYINTITQLVPQVEPKYIVSHNAATENGSGEGGNVGLASEKLGLTMDTEQEAIGTHEMGHGWHRLGDVYANAGGNSWPNATSDATGTKWADWLGYTEPYYKLKVGAYPIENSSYFRPLNTHCEMMADVYCAKPVVAHDPIGREKVVWDIYALTDPLDNWTPNTTTLVNPVQIKVDVVDSNVIKVDWYLNSVLVARDAGGTFIPAKYISKVGDYNLRAHAYDFVLTKAYSDRGKDSLGVPGSFPSDSLDWVRRKMDLLQQDITWKITVNQTALIGKEKPDLPNSRKNLPGQFSVVNVLGKYRIQSHSVGATPEYKIPGNFQKP